MDTNGIISSLVNDFLENSAKFLLVLGILVMGAGLYFKIYGTSEEDNIWFYYPLCVTGLISIFWGFAYSLKEYISFEIGYKRDKKNDDKVAPKRDAYYKALKGSNKEEALRLGRHYYSSLRANGRLTIYDEQAIANDINSMR